MPSARDSWNQFVRTAWDNRKKIMAPGLDQKHALECVKNVYTYYNLGDVSKIPNWQSLLSQGARAFIDRCGSREFWFQGESSSMVSGQELGEALGKLCFESLKVKNFSIPPYGQLESTKAIKATLKGFKDAKESGMISEDDYDKMVETIMEISTTKKKMEHDPALALNQFVWHQPKTKKAHGSMFRIYVAPTLEQTIPVYCDMVEDLMNAPGELGSIPTKLKVGTPKPDSNNRVDRIVVYCRDQTEMDGGVEWLRGYQKKNAARFQSQLPLATKPVDGLVGVSITPQPKPDHSVMVHAGRKKKTSTGISFGMSRSHVIYLGLRTALKKSAPNNTFNAYKQYVEAWARKAKLDIDLDGLAVD
ncbi:MAG: T3SS effector HopA1 family protein [Pseudomonadota bacterium]